MATVVNLPGSPNTGLSSLAQVLLGSATEYAQGRRADDREARLRAQRLADIESDRGYARTEGDRQYGRARTDRLADAETDRTRRLEDEETRARLGMVHELVRLRYLAPGEQNNPDAVAAAFARAQADGTAKRYEDALKSGDLSYADLGDPALVEAGLAAFSKRMGTRARFQESLPGEASTLVGQKEQQINNLMQRSSALEQVLSQPEPVPTPREVADLARRLAPLKKGQTQPSAEDIAAAIPQAEQQLRGDLAMRWNQARQDALIQRQLIGDQLRNLSAEVNTLRNRFGVVGAAPTSTANLAEPVAAPTGTLTSGAQPRLTPEQFAAQIRQQLGRTTPTSTEPSPSVSDGRAPILSIKGIGQRLSDAVPPARLAEAPLNIAAFPGRLLDTVGRYGAAGLQGIYDGNFTVPDKGLVTLAGEGIGNAIANDPRPLDMKFDRATDSVAKGINWLLSDPNDEREERILLVAPNSPEAFEIRRRRGLPQPNRLRDVGTATPAPVGSSSQWGR